MNQKSILSHVKSRVQEKEISPVDNDLSHYEKLKKTIILRTEAEIKNQIEIAKALYEIKTKKLYTYDGYKNFSLFLKNYNKGRTQAYLYISVVEGIHNGIIQEMEVLEKGFKFAKRVIYSNIKDSENKPSKQIIFAISSSKIQDNEKRDWIIQNKKSIEEYILNQANHHFLSFQKKIKK